MSDLRPPATGTEAYLAAIHEVLCDIRTVLVGGGQVQADEQTAQAEAHPAAAVRSAPSQVKRTRTRTRGAAT